MNDATMDGLVRYVEKGIPPGGFLESVLSNDLAMACAKADLANRYRLHEIVKFLFNYPPSSCWGAPEKVSRWLAMDDEERAKIVEGNPDWERRPTRFPALNPGPEVPRP